MSSRNIVNTILFAACFYIGWSLRGCEKNMAGRADVQNTFNNYERLIDVTATNCCYAGFFLGVKWLEEVKAGKIQDPNGEANFAITNWLTTRPGRAGRP